MKKHLRARERLIFSLDVNNLHDAEYWVRLLAGHVGMFKIGKELFTSCGTEAVKMVRDAGEKVFLDLKFHDIPSTAAMAGMSAAALGVSIFNIHSLGGREMMESVMRAVKAAGESEHESRPVVLAVTILTSMTEEDIVEIGLSSPLEERVAQLALLAQQAGVDGVVASPMEVRKIRDLTGNDFIIVTPGVRPEGTACNDQKRAMTPLDAVEAGSDYIVVGRPVRLSSDPVGVCESIIGEIEAL